RCDTNPEWLIRRVRDMSAPYSKRPAHGTSVCALLHPMRGEKPAVGAVRRPRGAEAERRYGENVSDGQALYHFRGQMRCWPRLVDCGQEGKLMGVADAPIGTPRRRVATLLRDLTFGSTTSRGPT